jgi:hypothetical protein
VWDRRGDVGCTMGRIVYRETRRSAAFVNVARPKRHLRPATRAMLAELFPSVDVEAIVIRTGCRLPANRFQPSGSIYAMTFGSTIYWRDDLDESDPGDLVRLIHEVVHVDQYRRFGGEAGFACAYGRGYVEGGGDVPPHIREPNAYHRNPLEAEAYRFAARFRDDHGRVDPELLPTG